MKCYGTGLQSYNCMGIFEVRFPSTTVNRWTWTSQLRDTLLCHTRFFMAMSSHYHRCLFGIFCSLASLADFCIAVAGNYGSSSALHIICGCGNLNFLHPFMVQAIFLFKTPKSFFVKIFMASEPDLKFKIYDHQQTHTKCR